MADKPKKIHIISHTHWDREWYLSFEKHRFRLVDMMDSLLETIDNDPLFRSFHLDGQIIILEDYLEIRPEMLPKIKKYIADGRLIIGPWYVLQDEFLITGEANVRNLLYGLKESKKYGSPCMLGYFPDAFGNISQAPQILNGFGITRAAFGRGIRAVGFDNEVLKQPGFENFSSEVVWRSPDGSEAVGVLFANWYSNCNDIPKDPEEIPAYIKRAVFAAETVSLTPHLLLMNGCDHQPVHTDIGQIIKQINDAQAIDGQLIHSNFNDYFDMIEAYKDDMPVVTGELTSRCTDGWHVLVNTASSRIYMKRKAFEVQRDMEKWAEPLGVMCEAAGVPYRSEMAYRAWKYLMENYPHDSICGCSIDEVHAEMMVRYQKAGDITEELISREKTALASMIDTEDADGTAVVVFNPHPWTADEFFTAEMLLPPENTIPVERFGLYDGDEKISAEIADSGVVRTYTLPDDSFRKIFNVRKLTVRARAREIPPLGYKTFFIRETGSAKDEAKLSVFKTGAESGVLRLDILPDGSLKVLDKRSGQFYEGLNVFEDMGDCGTEYVFKSPENDAIVTTKNTAAGVELVTASPERAVFKITHMLSLPVSSGAESRSADTVPFMIESFVTMDAGIPRLDIRTRFDNNIGDHRLRAIFPSGVKSGVCFADGQFDIVERQIEAWQGWKNPSKCERQQAFVEMKDQSRGLLIANQGLPEYEIIDENHIALTLLRSVGELGDWFHFQTKDAQCRGEHEVCYSVIPCGADGYVQARRQAVQFNTGELLAAQAGSQKGKLPLSYSFIDVESRHICCSALKQAEDKRGAVLRLYNPYAKKDTLRLKPSALWDTVHRTGLSEEITEELLPDALGMISLEIPPKKIVTLKLSKNNGQDVKV